MNLWRSLYIYNISGIGNARLSSQWVADEASGKGIKAVVQQIDRLGNVIFTSSNEIGLKPVNYLIRYTSLTSWSFWRRSINKRNLKNQNNRNIITASANIKS